MKRRDYGTGSIRQRGERWYFRYRLHGKYHEQAIVDPDTGKNPRTKSHAARIAQIMGAVVAGQQRAGFRGAEHISLAEIDQAFLMAFPQAYSKRDRISRRAAMRRFCETFPTVGDVSHEGIGKYVSRRLETPKERGGGKRSPAMVTAVEK